MGALATLTCAVREVSNCWAGDEIKSGPPMGVLATSPLPLGGSRTHQSGGYDQKWRSSRWIDYMTLANWRVPNALQ